MKIKNTTSILYQLRNHMKIGSCSNNERLDSVIVLATDAHTSTYLLAEQDKRTDYITGFTGGVGTAVVTSSTAVLWVEGSKNRQAEKEVDENWTVLVVGLRDTPSIPRWLLATLHPASNVGINPNLCSIKLWKDLSDQLCVNGHKLIALSKDLVDEVWNEKRAVTSTNLYIIPQSHTGKTVSAKFQDVWIEMESKGCDWLILSALDDVAWILNMRGRDIKHNTVFFAYVVVKKNIVHLFIQQQVITEEIKCHLSQIHVVYHPYEELFPFVVENCCCGKVWMAKNTSIAIRRLIGDDNVLLSAHSPVSLRKVVKNKSEIDGMKKANLLDSVAFSQFLEWLETEVPIGTVTECSAANKIMEFRNKQEGFVTSSFPVLSASGPHSSYEHYSPFEDDDRCLSNNETYYHDSGAHYIFGTTDTTRGVHFGTPTKEHKECFTRVLKGHIAIATVVFPLGTKGHTLDILARKHLWKKGLDYTHGTGHGVGCGLDVTEGPNEYTSIIKNILTLDKECEILPGMIITDEPGYYDPDKFGFRIENEMICVEAHTKYNFNKTKFLKFEVITFVPIQRNMIDVTMLSCKELKWLNDYHQKCREVVGAEMTRQNVSSSTIDWLMKETQPI